MQLRITPLIASLAPGVLIDLVTGPDWTVTPTPIGNKQSTVVQATITNLRRHPFLRLEHLHEPQCHYYFDGPIGRRKGGS